MMKRPKPDRIDNLRRLMKAEGVDALLVTKRENVRYLTGFTGSAGSFLVTPGRSWLITDFRYKLQSRRETSGTTILIQKTDFPTALQETALSAGIDSLWFDESSLTIEELKKLRKRGLKPRGHRDIVGELRKRKDKQELASIRKAIRRAEESFRELKKYIRPGARERRLAFTLECLMREKGARKAAFDTIVASGRNGAMPHASVTDRRIKAGDLVTFDFGAEAGGYFCDITRTFCLGRPSARQLEIHGLVQEAQLAAIKSVRPGVSCKSVDDAARDVIKKANHGSHFGHGTGHGIGLMVHEAPSVSPLSRDSVAQDMVFTVEPGVYIPDWGGVRIEDMVLVTERGAKVLTTLPRELDGLRSL
ncbi:MAG TPA: aminopeptidase P family protein [Nitrospirota bacterium]|nr:aminopeptidase P family protein [Nitrospirota bacterium]